MNNAHESPRQRHVHLGTRLEVAESIRQHRSTPDQAAQALGVPVGDVLEWLSSGERPVSIDEVLVSPDAQRLTRRAQRLVALIAEADAAIRELTDRLARGMRVSHHAAE